MTHAFFHAPLDDADFGTSASLAQALGMKGCKKVMPYREQYYGGVAGEIVPTDLSLLRRAFPYIAGNVRCHGIRQAGLPDSCGCGRRQYDQ